MTTSRTVPKIPTREVDQGSDTAISTATRSALFDQAAGSRQTGSVRLARGITTAALTRYPRRHGHAR